MRKHFPSSSSCQPQPFAQNSIPSGPLKYVHLLPSQPAYVQACHQANPLSAFCPISFPPLKNTSFYPTLMISMPCSSCLTKLSLKHHIPFEPPAHFPSTPATLPSNKRPPSTSSVVFHPDQKTSHSQVDRCLNKNSDEWTDTQENGLITGPVIPGQKHQEPLTEITEEEEMQAFGM
ncbi:mCG13911 [Mus musculus]|uniref:Uncharacterized protein n=1 Tax=Mus musculus TaxID=10090 RepID=Q9DAJ8_MOUSE|nr:mCG13911 [Mus musculus]BAB24237.1 unnamed protein product [Mus musculus]|eukprot:NP_081324.1 uncharacterized protein LOC69347 [Mus musculus]